MFHCRSYAVKEHVGVFKLTDHFDIFDADTGRQVGVATENIGGLARAFRFLLNKQKRFLPTTVEFREQDDLPVLLTLKRGFSFLRPKVSVIDADGRNIGYFRGKLFSFNGGFFVYDASDNLISEVKGNWKGFNFKFLTPEGRELGTVDKQWGGLMKEMFTSADTYHIKIAEDLGTNPAMAALLLAAGIAIDVVFKE
ncbi:MAG: oxidoreductase [Planctomycetia bacterium]|nr:oxidoreductase [Planctomycetia bacterium]